MKVHYITTGCVLVEEDGSGILLGCVSEVVKYLAAQHLSHVKLVGIVLSDTAHFAGISNWAIEFPVYKALFVDGGLASERKLSIIGTPSQLSRARALLSITLFGPTVADYRKWTRRYGLSHLRFDAIRKVSEALRLVSKQGKAYELDELVNFIPFANEKAEVEAFEIRKPRKPDEFFVKIAGEVEGVLITLSFKTRPKAPFAMAPSEEVHPPLRLGVRVLSYGNGFDPTSGCTALVVWLNGIPILWDAAPFVSEALAVYGLSVEDMGGVFLTHVHDDHASLLEFKELGRRVKLFTTPEVYESVLIKMAALLGIRLDVPSERAELEQFFEFRRIDAERATTIYGVDVFLHQCIHSIPTWGATFVVSHGSEKKHLLLTGDTVGPMRLRQLIESRAVSKPWAERLLALPSGNEALAIMDGGADRAGLHPNPMTDPELRTLMKRMGKRLYFGHRGTTPVDDPLLNLVVPGTLLVVDEGNVEHNDFGVFRRALANLGVDDELEARALFSQGDICTEKSGEVLVREGDEPSGFYVLLFGTVAVKNGSDVVAHLTSGAFFGEVAILTKGRRNATVETVSSVRVLVIPQNAFAQFAEIHTLLPQLRKTWTKRELLAQVQLFRTMPWTAMADVSRVASEVSFDAGVEIIKQGSTTRDFYVITDGKVGVFQNDQKVAELCTNEVFGEMAALLSEPRSATVRSLSSVKLLRLSGEELHRLAATSVSLTYSLRTLIAERRVK